MDGMAFGTGSAIAHRAVDAIAGPRTVVHEHRNAEAPAAPAAAAAPITQSGSMQKCHDELLRFNHCLAQNNNQLSSCRFFFDALSQCQHDANF